MFASKANYFIFNLHVMKSMIILKVFKRLTVHSETAGPKHIFLMYLLFICNIIHLKCEIPYSFDLILTQCLIHLEFWIFNFWIKIYICVLYI